MELDNILVRQKDSLIEKINGGEFMEALIILGAVRELWIESGYGYKVNELINRIYCDERIISEEKNKIDRMCDDLTVGQAIIAIKAGKTPL